MEGLISWTEIKTKMAERIRDQVVMLVLYHWMELALIKYYIVLILIWHFLRNYLRDGEYLRTNLRTMENEEREVQRLVVDARAHGEKVLPRVERWLNGVGQTRNDSENRWKFLWKRIMHAEEIKAAVGKLVLHGGSIDRVSISQYKMSIFHEIVEAFKDNGIIRIGLYGECGEGKTTLVKEIVEEAVDTGLFKEVVTVNVTVTSSNQKKIIDEIADQLGLTIPNMYTEEGRAKWLSKILEEKTSILVILHNVQAVVRWAEAGIPNREFRCNGCKILLVSQNKDVCLDSGVKNELNFLIN